MLRAIFAGGAALILLLSTCARAVQSSEHIASISETAVRINVRDHGALGDGISDDRAAIQSALDAAFPGTEIWIPNGRYLVGKGAGFWCLNVPAGITIRGESRDRTIIVQAPRIAGSVRLFQIDKADVTITTLTLDGDQGSQTPDEHRAAVFSTAAGTILREVTAQAFTGDGFYFYTGADRFLINRSLSTGNDRNGMTIGGTSMGGRVIDSHFARSRAQQFDSEPGSLGVISGVTITRSVFDGEGQSTDYVLTVSGGSSSVHAQDWTVLDNTLNGGLHVVWADRIEIRGNIGVNPTGHPNISIYRSCRDNTIEGNNLISLPPNSLGTINVTATGEGGPTGTLIRHNRLVGDSFAIRAEGGASLEIADNDLIGPGVASAGAGIYLRATNPMQPFSYAVIRRNRIQNFGSVAVRVQGNGTAALTLLDLSDNVLEDSAGTMVGAFALNDGTGAAKDVRESGTIMLGGCTKKLVGLPPAGAVVDWTGQRWLVK